MEVLATGEAAPQCAWVGKLQMAAVQRLLPEPDPAASQSMVLSLAPELSLPTAVWLCRLSAAPGSASYLTVR